MRSGSAAAAFISSRSISLDSNAAIDIGGSSSSEFSLSPDARRKLVAP